MRGRRRSGDGHVPPPEEPSFTARLFKLTNVFTSETMDEKPVLHPPLLYEATVELPVPHGTAAPPGTEMIEISTRPVSKKYHRHSPLKAALGWPNRWVNPRTDTITKVSFKPMAPTKRLDIPQLNGESFASPGYTIVRLTSSEPVITLVTEDPSIGPTEITVDNTSALANLERIADAFAASGGFHPPDRASGTGHVAGSAS